MDSSKDLFGQSSYGKRLNYSKPKYNDVWAAIIYIIQVLAIIVICVYLWVTQVQNISRKTHNSLSTINPADIFVILFCCMLAGILIGLIWLQIIKKWAGIVIKAMLFINIALWMLVFVLGIVYNNLALVIIGLVVALIFALFAWCVWRRIPFASVLLV